MYQNPQFNPQNLDFQLQQMAQNVRQNFGGLSPKEVVQRMLDSGQMTQQQYNEIRQKANQILGTNY